MSVFGPKKTLISLAPRIDLDRTRCTPGTMLTASSIGRVIANTICRALSVLPSATIVTRGNVSSG